MPTVYKGALGSVAPCVLPASCGARLPRLHRLARKILPTVLGVEVVSRPTSGVESVLACVCGVVCVCVLQPRSRPPKSGGLCDCTRFANNRLARKIPPTVLGVGVVSRPTYGVESVSCLLLAHSMLACSSSTASSSSTFSSSITTLLPLPHWFLVCRPSSMLGPQFFLPTALSSRSSVYEDFIVAVCPGCCRPQH